MRSSWALVRRDVARLLWRPRSFGLLAYMGASAWAGASPPTTSSADGIDAVGVSIADAVPSAFQSAWVLVAVQAVPVALLAAALIVEDREAGGTWMTVHRAGGVPRWWTAKALAAVALACLAVLTSALLILAAALARGWVPTADISEYARAPAELGYERIAGTSPAATSALALVLRAGVLAAVALFSLAVGAACRRPALGYALPVIAVLAYWRLGARALPEDLSLRADLLQQAFWDHHGRGFAISWWWTAVALGGWLLAALAAGRLVVRRVEITEAR